MTTRKRAAGKNDGFVALKLKPINAEQAYDNGWNQALLNAESICYEGGIRATPAALAEKIRSLRNDLPDEEPTA